MSVFCKYTACEWNRWDQQNLKHRCNKTIRHLNEKGCCEIGNFARPITSKPEHGCKFCAHLAYCVCDN